MVTKRRRPLDTKSFLAHVGNGQSIGKYRKGQSAARLLILYNTIKTLKACEVDPYLDQQAVDTTKPSGKPMLQMTVAFAESSGR